MPGLYKAIAAIEDPAAPAEPPLERERFMEMDEAERWALVQEGLRRLRILDEEGTILTDPAALYPKNKKKAPVLRGLRGSVWFV